PLPNQGSPRRQGHGRRFTIRSGPGHHHLPRTLATNSLNSRTTDRAPGNRGPRGQGRGRPRGGAGKPSHGPSSQPASYDVPLLHPIDVDTTPVPFTSLGLDHRLLEGTRDLGWKDTRPIQTARIPLALAGRDLIACAETGTGKTAAFVVPILQRLLAGDPKAREADATKSHVLVLAPTRELAVQIEDEIHGLAYHTSITSAAVYGGVEMGGQERALRAGVDIIVATPGRLMDHMRQQNADLGAIDLLVLDEADRMMDMGFWPDVKRIITVLPAARQTLLFSATMPDEVVRLALEI